MIAAAPLAGFQGKMTSMMTLRKLVDYVSAEPFRPFRINMASGRSFDVRHPENIAVSKTTAKVFSPVENPDAEERWHDVSLILIGTIEPLDSLVAHNKKN